MTGVLTGFAIIGAVILTGYIVQRSQLIGTAALVPISRLIYFVLSPALLFTVMIEADINVLFSLPVLVLVLALIICAAAYLVASLVFFRQPAAESVIGMLGSVQTNATNIGLPVSIYVLGDGQFVAPVILFQTLVVVPICLVVLDLSTQAKVTPATILLQPFRNPAIIAALTGFALTLFGVEVPVPVLAPFELVGAAAVPLFLMTFGMALHGQRPFSRGVGLRPDIVTVLSLKVLLMPLTAYLLAQFVFEFAPETVFMVVVLSALPSAQNVYNFAVRFGRGESLALNCVTLSTFLALPVLLLGTSLLGA